MYCNFKLRFPEIYKLCCSLWDIRYTKQIYSEFCDFSLDTLVKIQHLKFEISIHVIY